MLIVFEGIDGSGKTTLSNKLAHALAAGGTSVEHVRENGRYASDIAQELRELGRDARNLALVPEAELLLLLAREAQLFAETTRPALARTDVVIADRFFHSAEILAVHGRGLDPARVRALVNAASGGIEPDLVILVDVDPHVARARRRVQKLIQPRAPPQGPSRKNLAGAGLMRLLRQGYLEMAAASPDRWIVLGNTDQSLEQTEEQLVAWSRIALHLGAEAAVRAFTSTHAPQAHVSALPDVNAAAARFLEWVDRRSDYEPAVAAHFVGGLSGPAIDRRRRALAHVAPQAIAEGIAGLADPASWALRETLVPLAPRNVARSLRGEAAHGERAQRTRDRLMPTVPAEVAISLTRCTDERSWELRKQLLRVVPSAVVASLAGIDEEQAWHWRGRLRDARGNDPQAWIALCESVEGLDSDRAWDIRRAALSQHPVEALASLRGVFTETAWEWRERFAAKAPRVVMRSVNGSTDPRAWALRSSLVARCKEALDSISGIDDDAAWALRNDMVDRWPSTVVKSVGRALISTPRAQSLLARQLSRHPGDLSLLKYATSLALAASADSAISATSALT